jgi:hypothetical protein
VALGTPWWRSLESVLVAFWPFRHPGVDACWWRLAQRFGGGGPSLRFPSSFRPATRRAISPNFCGGCRPRLRIRVIFVEGHSCDDTVAAIERAIAEPRPGPAACCASAALGRGCCSGGFAQAKGDIS